MKDRPTKQLIQIIERQDYWRNLSVRTLESAGFLVQTLDHYNYPPSKQTKDSLPDLVILGCAAVGGQEQQLIARVLREKLHLLVLCTTLPSQVMRSLFLAGVDDVADKPFDETQLLAIVKQALGSHAVRAHSQAE